MEVYGTRCEVIVFSGSLGKIQCSCHVKFTVFCVPGWRDGCEGHFRGNCYLHNKTDWEDLM